MTATIRLGRRSDVWTNRFRTFAVILNGQRVGRIGRGEVLDWDVPAGDFTLRVTIDWCGSPQLSGRIEAGQVRTFEVGNGDALGGLFARDRYLELIETGDSSQRVGAPRTSPPGNTT